jgi:hypothetical protein
MADSGFIPKTVHAEPPDLTVFDDDYRAAKPPDTGEVPDGRYDVRVQSMVLDRSQNGDPMLTYDLVVRAGPHARTSSRTP